MLEHTLVPTQVWRIGAACGAESARQGAQKARMRALEVSCVGCGPETPKGVSILLPGYPNDQAKQTDLQPAVSPSGA